MNYVKIYVSVLAEFSASGGLKPLSLTWDDGRKFSIDRVKYIERKPCKSGGILPMRYTVLIDGQERYLYYVRDDARWFVEKLYQ